MTYNDVLLLIQTEVIANGNNEITADVLRPVLEEILNFPNDTIGQLGNLNTSDQSSIVNAINEVIASGSSGIVILTGTDDPNITPPAVFGLADFYYRTGVATELYIYNGTSWFLLATNSSSVLGFYDLDLVIFNYNLQPNDYTLYLKADNNIQVSLTLASLSTGRVIRVINASTTGTINFTLIGFLDLDGSVISLVPAQTKYTIQCDGSAWRVV